MIGNKMKLLHNHPVAITSVATGHLYHSNIFLECYLAKHKDITNLVWYTITVPVIGKIWRQIGYKRHSVCKYYNLPYLANIRDCDVVTNGQIRIIERKLGSAHIKRIIPKECTIEV